MVASRKQPDAPGVTHATVTIDALRPHPRNYRQHPDSQVGRLAASLARFGQVRSIVVQEGADGRYLIVAGHGLAEAAKREGLTELHADVIPAHWTPEQVEGYLVADNESSREAEDDLAALAAMLDEQRNAGYHLESLGFSDDDLTALLDQLADETLGVDGADNSGEDDDTATGEALPRVTLADRFIVPPFSVLDARQGYWQARKRAWIALGIQSELGRGGAEPGGSLRDATTLGPDGRTQRGDGYGHPIESASLKDGLTWPTSIHPYDKTGQKRNGLLGFSEQARSHYREGSTLGAIPPNERDRMSRSGSYAQHGKGEATASYKSQGRLTALQRTGDSRAVVYGTAGNVSTQSGTSIFDPVLCELAYRWFCPPDGTVLDPFAGGSVRGIVAAKLGRRYIGIDLRPEQIAANEAQAQDMTPENAPHWIVGDSRNLDSLLPSDTQADLLFTCPPYYDLEVYSDNAHDLSTASTYGDFLNDYRAILHAAVARLRADRFACVVVGDIRDNKGFYRNFVADTITAMQDAGARYYNEAILVTVAGSLPVRVGRQFSAGRKLGKTHQNVLVFCKGDPKRAALACGEVDVALPEDMLDEMDEANGPQIEIHA